MGLTEIVLLVIGGLFFVISFFLPDGKNKEEKIDEARIREMVDKELKEARSKIDDMVEETVNYSVEKTERALEKLSNEKIMAVDEYSQTVLKKINDNHNEAVFLYDMLNDKDEKLKNVGEEIKNATIALEKSSEAALQMAETENKGEIQAEAPAKEPEKASEDAFVPFIPKVYEIKNGQAVLAGEEDKEPSEVVPEFTPKKPAPAKAKAEPKPKTAKPSSRKQTNKAPEAPIDAATGLRTENDGRKNSNEIIKRMHEEGMSNMQIAKELGLGVGEVKLVIDLFASGKDRRQ